MKWSVILLALLPSVAFGQAIPADSVSPDDFLWQKRPVVVFADSAEDPSFRAQMDYITRDADALEERDVVVVTDTDPAANSEFRQKLRPRGFAIVIMDKDGEVKQRKPLPWHVREIARAIDKFPLRRQEVEDLYPGRY